MKHNCYTCIKSPDKSAPFRCPYVTRVSYSATWSEYINDPCKHVYPDDDDCLKWSVSLPKTIRYFSDIATGILIPMAITAVVVGLVVAIVSFIITSKAIMGV